MEKLTFTNSNDLLIEFGAQFPYLLGDISGIGEIPYNVQVFNAHGIHGSLYYDTLASARIVKFDFWFNASTHEALHTARALIQQICNPVLGEGELIYENDIGKWRIPAAVFYGPVMLPSKPKDRQRLYQHAEIGFVCEQPFWQSYVEYQTTIVGRTGGLEFPLEFPIHFATLADNVEINNTGYVDTPLRIDFHGAATLCRVTKNETGEYIEVTYTLLEDERLVIDTNPISQSVTFIESDDTETSAFNKINAASTFFQLTPGINTIAFTSGTGSPVVYLFYHLRYTGV